MSDECFFNHDGTIADAHNQRPCASTANGPSYCCAIGDICEGDNICHFTGPGAILGATYSTYYLGSCTDILYENSTACTPHCTTSDTSSNGGQTDVVYNTTSNQWACCGATVNGPHCNVPTKEVFSARAPSAMTNSAVVLSTGIPSNSAPPTSTSTTSPVSSTTSTTSTGTATTPAPQSTDSGLSSGTKVGIGVGVAIGVLALLALLGILLVSRRKHKKRLETARYSQQGSAYARFRASQQRAPMGYLDHLGKNAVKPLAGESALGRQELGGGLDARPVEMEGGSRPVEMDALGRVRR